MLRLPNCKINIGLYITNRRADGYHDLETIFYPVPFNDVLEIVPAKETAMHLSGLPVTGDDKNNLVWKAYDLLKGKFRDKVPALDIFLHKVIPTGAGLGGGSSDGAFMLAMVNDYCRLGLSSKELRAMALELGSDCPFFIYNTSHFASGRGEKMTPVTVDLSKYSIMLICPEVHVSTGKAFSAITPHPAPFDLRQIANLQLNEWKNHISNDFEAPIFKQQPVLKEIKDALYNQGAIYASMSGSGSALYGIFEKGYKADVSFQNAIAFYLE